MAWLRFGRLGWHYVAFDSYLRELGRYRFVASPPGNGPDCHRTWEALLAGTIPIVLDIPSMGSLFDGLPVMRVRSPEEITPEALEEAYIRFSVPGRSYKWEKLFAKYWVDRVVKAGISDSAISSP